MLVRSNQFTLLLFWLLSAAVSCGGPTVDNKRANTRLDIAKEYLSKGRLTRLKEAEIEARKALRYNPKSADAYNVLGLIDYMMAVGNVQLLEVEDCLTGVDSEALRDELDQHLLDAGKDLAEAVRLDAEFADAWANRGQVALRLGENDKAIDYLDRALLVRQRLSQIALVRADLGWAHFHNDNHAEAAKHLRQALQFAPKHCIGNYRLGRVYFTRNEFPKALERFDVVTSDLGCAMQEAHLYKLKTMLAMKHTDGYDEVRQSCLKVWPNSCIARECTTTAQ